MAIVTRHQPGVYTGATIWDSTESTAYTGTTATTSASISWVDTTNGATTVYPTREAQWASDNVRVTFRPPQFSEDEDKTEKGIHPQLYFKYVKSKMNKIQKEKLKERLSKLQRLVKQTKEMGQQALHEEFAQKIAEVVRESEIAACGINSSVPKEVIQKFRYRVRGDLDIMLEELKDYDRVIPNAVVKKVRMCRKLGLFDKYWVLYIDHKEKTDVDEVKKKVEKLKTNKEKIKEKDPILFGTHDFNPNTFYFIIDWIDEYCDLTLDKFVKDVKKNDPEFGLDRIPEMNKSEVNRIVKEAEQRKHRLKITTQSNFKRLMELEEWKTFPSRIKHWYLTKWRDLVLDTQVKEFDRWKRNLSKEKREARWTLLSLKMQVYLNTGTAFFADKWRGVRTRCSDMIESVREFWEMEQCWERFKGLFKRNND